MMSPPVRKKTAFITEKYEDLYKFSDRVALWRQGIAVRSGNTNESDGYLRLEVVRLMGAKVTARSLLSGPLTKTRDERRGKSVVTETNSSPSFVGVGSWDARQYSYT